MATVGLFATWGAALFAAWAFVGGLVGTAPGHPARRSAERALVATAISSAVATAALATLLLAGDVTISYVARSIATNLTNGYRLAALWHLPSGSVLPTATLVALAGGLVTARSRSTLGIASVGAIVMALLAASLAARPFATLPWVPSEGLGLSPALQHPLSIVGRVALSLAIAAASAMVALASDDLAEPRTHEGRDGEPHASGGRTATRLTGAMLALLALAMWGWARGTFATGTASSPAAWSAWGGALIPALVAVAFAITTARSSGTPRFSASLGALGLLCSVLLGGGTPRPGGWPLAAFVVLSLAASAWGAAAVASRQPRASAHLLALVSIVLVVAGSAAVVWRGGGALQGVPPAAQWLLLAGAGTGVASRVAAGGLTGRVAPWGGALLAAGGLALGVWLAPAGTPAAWWCLVGGMALGGVALAVAGRAGHAGRLAGAAQLLAIALAAVAAAGEGRAVVSLVPLASGERTTVAMRFGDPVVLAHQGISRYQDGNAHVAALAIEPSRAGRAIPVVSTHRREYVDSRDEILGPPTTHPVVLDFRLESLRIAVDDIDAEERALVRLSAVPFASAWTLALVATVLAALLQSVPPHRARAPSDPHGTSSE